MHSQSPIAHECLSSLSDQFTIAIVIPISTGMPWGLGWIQLKRSKYVKGNGCGEKNRYAKVGHAFHLICNRFFVMNENQSGEVFAKYCILRWVIIH